MTVQVIGQGFDVGESLTEHVKTTLDKKFSKYNQEVIGANVVFNQAPHKKVNAAIKLQIKGMDLFAKSDNDDAYSAFNSAMADIESQFTKNMEKLRSYK